MRAQYDNDRTQRGHEQHRHQRWQPWQRCLDEAGARGGTLRADYSDAERYLQRREFLGWVALRVLVPPEGQPHTFAAAALGRYTDDLCDRGPVGERTQRFDEWAARVGTALDTGSSAHPLLRAYLHSAHLLNLSRKWIDAYLAGIRVDLEFPGFAQEVDYQRYVDTVSLPAFMFATEVVPRLVPDQCFTSSARLIADGTQRTDFLTDLFEDLRDGRLTLPVRDLDHHGVTRADLRDGLDTPAVRALISATASSARASLVEGERILGEIAPDYRPMFRCLIGAFHKRLHDVGTRGAAVIRRPYHDPPVASLRLMVRSRFMGPSTTPCSRGAG
jgi:phytoene synthase